MKKNILLVEPPYKTVYPPLGLMKISTWHRRRGDYVDFIKHTPEQYKRKIFEWNMKELKGIFDKKYDIIYVTTLFTYYYQEVIDTIKFYKELFPKADIKIGGVMATLLPEKIEQETCIKPHIGLLSKIEYFPPDYKLFPNIDYSISFTTRGCERNCSFCTVKKHEPKFIVKNEWEKDINIMYNKIIFWDNNWFYSPNLEKDINKLLEFKKKGINNIDFNQGLDCRLFTEDIAKSIRDLPIKPLRFAFDNHSEDGYVQKAIKLAQRYGFKDIRVYVLYNSEFKQDTPEYFYYRINEINKLGALSYPMRYRPLDALNMNQCYNFISNKWDKELLRALKLTLMFYYSKGMITKSKESFLKIYGNNAKEFVEKMKKIYIKDKKMKKRGRR